MSIFTSLVYLRFISSYYPTIPLYLNLMKKLWFRFSWDWRNKMDKTRWPQVILALLTRRRTAAGHVALALLPSQRAMLWKPRCVRGLKWRNMEKLEGRKGRPWKLGGFLGCKHFIGVSQIGFMMLNQNSGFESCAHLSGGMGILGFSCWKDGEAMATKWVDGWWVVLPRFWMRCSQVLPMRLMVELWIAKGPGPRKLCWGSLAPEFEHSSDTSNEVFLMVL